MKNLMSGQRMRQLELEGRATLVTYVGMQKRAVYRINNTFYEQAINFGKDHDHYWQISPNRAAEILKELLNESIRSR